MCAVVGLDLELEEAREVAQLQVGVRICLASEDQRVDVAALLDALAGAKRALEKADVEADVVPDERRVARPGQELLSSLLRRWRVLDVLVGDPVELLPDDR